MRLHYARYDRDPNHSKSTTSRKDSLGLGVCARVCMSARACVYECVCVCVFVCVCVRESIKRVALKFIIACTYTYDRG